MDQTTTGTRAIVGGFILSVAILVVTFLDSSFISHSLAALLESIIYLAAMTFHLNVIGKMNATITSLKSGIAPTQN